MLTVELPEETPPPTTLKEREPVVSARSAVEAPPDPEVPPAETDGPPLTRPLNWELVVSTTELDPLLPVDEEEAPAGPPVTEEEKLIPEDDGTPVDVGAPEEEAWAETWELWAAEAVLSVTEVVGPYVCWICCSSVMVMMLPPVKRVGRM